MDPGCYVDAATTDATGQNKDGAAPELDASTSDVALPDVALPDAWPGSDGPIISDTISNDVSNDALPDTALDVRGDGFTCITAPADPVFCFDFDQTPVTNHAQCASPTTRTAAIATAPTNLIADDLGISWFAAPDQIWTLETNASLPRLVAVAPTITTRRPFYLDATRYYFEEELVGGEFDIMSVRRSGGDRNRLVKSRSGILAVATGELYYESDGFLASVTKFGDAFVTTPVAIATLGEFIVDATHIYYAEHGATDSTLKRVVRDGTGGEVLVEHLRSVAFLREDGDYVYWVEGSKTDATAVKRLAKAGGPPEVLANLGGIVADVMFQGESLIFVSSSRVYEVPKAGGCPHLLVNMPSYVIEGFTADQFGLFWKTATDATLSTTHVWRAPRTGGVHVQLGDPLDKPRGASSVAINTTRFWWVTDQTVEVLNR